MQILPNPLNPEPEDVRIALRERCESGDLLQRMTARKLLDLIEWLEARGPQPQFSVSVFRNELWLFAPGSEGLIKLWLDRNDYAPLEGDEIAFHVQINYQPADSSLSVDRRATDPEQVEWYLHEAVLRLRKRRR